MNKILKLYATGVTIIALVFYFFFVYNKGQIEKLKYDNQELSTRLETYKNKLEKEHNDKVELNKRNKNLEEKAKNSPDFNWYANIFDDPVVVELRKQAKNHRSRK